MLLLERTARFLGQKGKENAAPLIASGVFGALAYFYAFTNKLVNHDEVQSLFMKGATVDSGRWGLGALDSIFPNYSMPWIYGVITIVLMAVSVCLILNTLEIKSKVLQVLMAGSVLVFPSLIGTFGYMFTSSSYAVSFLLASLAVWFIQKRHWLWGLPAGVCMVLSLSIYQSYIAVAASLLVLVLIRQLLREDQPLAVLLRGIWFVAFLLASLAVYYVGTQVVLKVTGVEMNTYASGSITLSLATLPSAIGLAYESFWKFFADSHRGLILGDLSRMMHYVVLVVIAALLMMWLVRENGKGLVRVLLLLVLVAVLPLAINCMYLITSDESIHTLVLYGFVAVYFLAAILAEELLPEHFPGKALEFGRQIALNLLTLAIGLILISNIYLANEAYLHMQLRYENTYAFYSSLVTDLRNTPEFTEDCKIAIIGNWEKPEFYEEEFGFLHHLTGVHGIAPDSYSKNRFLEYYIGIELNFPTEAEIAAIQSSPEFEAMACYPYYGSILMVGDTLVVKLS